MKDLLSSLVSPVWWILIVVVAIVVNMLNAYGKPLTAKLCARFSAKVRAALDMENERRSAMVHRICDDPQYEMTCKRQEMRHRARGLLCGLAGVDLVGFGLTFSTLLYSLPHRYLQLSRLSVESFVATFCTAGLWLSMFAGVFAVALGFRQWASAETLAQQALEGRKARGSANKSINPSIPNQLTTTLPLP